MNPSTRGAARVSIMWLISIGVVAILALAFAFLTNGDLETANNARATAETNEQIAKDARTADLEVRRDVSAAFGFAGEGPDYNSDLPAASSAYQQLRDNFDDLTEADQTLEDMYPKMIGELNAARQARATAEEARDNAMADAQTARGSLSTVTSDKDAVIQRQKSEAADAQSQFDETEGTLSSNLNAAQDRVRELEDEIASLKAESRALAREVRGQINEKDAQIAYLSQLTQPLRAPANLNPDGQILQVSQDLPLAWIDLGSDSRLVLGTRFTVEAGSLGERHLKAWAEVIEVQKDMAKVRLFDQVDAFDPVVAGDYIVNPVYDPKGGFNALLVGRFSGLYAKEQLSSLLGEIGIRVQGGLDLTTNFLIVGEPIMQDEDGYPLEEPIEPSDLPVYQEAVANGVQIIPLSQIEQFFVF